MSIFSIVGKPEPQWAKDFKAKVIAPDYLPNPLKKVQSNDATKTIQTVEKDVKIIVWVIVAFFVVSIFAPRR
jgi:hypothetical protein